MDAATLVSSLQSLVRSATIQEVPSVDYPTLYVSREHIVDVLAALRDGPDLGFSLLAELTAADLFPREPRFEVVYQMARLGVRDFPRPGLDLAPARVRVKVALPGTDPVLPSIHRAFPLADWCEREVWDLFGIVFEGHPGLVRLLTPDDWEGHPLRKDYPVQVKVPVRSTEPLQITEKEFVESIRRQRADGWKHRE